MMGVTLLFILVSATTLGCGVVVSMRVHIVLVLLVQGVVGEVRVGIAQVSCIRGPMSAERARDATNNTHTRGRRHPHSFHVHEPPRGAPPQTLEIERSWRALLASLTRKGNGTYLYGSLQSRTIASRHRYTRRGSTDVIKT